jgi:hypothetical protein
MTKITSENLQNDQNNPEMIKIPKNKKLKYTENTKITPKIPI